jgi:valyl-tRNA synthetase
MKDMSKTYSPQESEDKIYKQWEESGYFNPDNLTGEEYSVMMPPPNVTGVLHLGHALEHTIMDTKVRFERMNGKKTLLIPGTDHAAVATQAKVEKILIEQKNISDPRATLGRDALLKEIRTFAEDSKKTILDQIRKLGTSCDWSRLAYTFDDDRSFAVNTVFKKMFDDGLIYRGYRVVNWSVKGQSTCSDDELEYIERPAKLYTFKYAHDFPISIATTRPETKLGDTAVAVHPDDQRYQEFIGKTFTVDVGALKPLSITIITDVNIDPSFGTGALGVTPAHSAVDFDMYEKQKALGKPIDLIPVIDTKGKMTVNAGSAYEGLSVDQAREKFVMWLRENDLLEKEEDIIQNSGTSDRFKDVVEPIPMTQWFIDVNKKIPGRKKTLKELMIDAVTTGLHEDPGQKITITPGRFEKIYLQWINELRDWCISRQIWWGHRIPVWYCDACNEMTVSTLKPNTCGVCNSKKITQDPDTLDTWFSSGLWTFSTLGWPRETDELKKFHPSSWMQMGHEILFFWMARMILMSTYALNEIPFKDVYIHGILRDENGNKFSKSAGNNIDPLDVSAQYGTDALRLSLIMGLTPGNDSKFYEEKVVSSRNFINKLWNISRFICQKNQDGISCEDIAIANLTVFDKMILEKMRNLIEHVHNDFSQYRFSQAAEKLHHFSRNDLADWYIEVSKFEENTNEKNAILHMILEDLLILWHPFIPFVTEEIWQDMQKDTLLLVTQIPQKKKYEDLVKKGNANSTDAEIIQEIITTIRGIIKQYTDNAKDLTIYISDTQQVRGTKDLVKDHENIIKNLRTGTKKIIMNEKTVALPKNIVSRTTSHGITINIPLEGLIDIKKEKMHKEKEYADMSNFANRIEKKLKNRSFVEKAPEEIVAAEKSKLADAHAKMKEIRSYIDSII